MPNNARIHSLVLYLWGTYDISSESNQPPKEEIIVFVAFRFHYECESLSISSKFS